MMVMRTASWWRAEQRMAQMQAQESIIEADLAMLQEREDRIRQLEVSSCTTL